MTCGNKSLADFKIICEKKKLNFLNFEDTEKDIYDMYLKKNY